MNEAKTETDWRDGKDVGSIRIVQALERFLRTASLDARQRSHVEARISNYKAGHSKFEFKGIDVEMLTDTALVGQALGDMSKL